LEQNGASRANLENGLFTVEISLDFIGGFDKSSDPNGKDVSLQVSHTNAIVVTDLTGVTFEKMIEKYITIGLMQQSLNDHLKEINYIFATVNIDNELSKEYAWIAPTITSYCVFSPLGSSEPFLAILTLTGDKDTAKARYQRLSQEVSPGLIPNGCTAGFAISSPLFIQHFIVPSVNSTMDDSKNAAFAYDPNNEAMNNGKQFNLNSITYLGITYTPYVEPNDFNMKVMNGKLRFNCAYTCPISPGIRGKGSLQQFFSLKLSDDKTKFNLDEDTSAKKEEHHADVDSWVTITEIVISLVVGIASLVVGVIVETASKAVKWLLIVIVGAILEIIVQIPQFIMLHGLDALSKFELSFTFLATGVRTIAWQGVDAFQPTYANFENCLLLGGNPVLN